MASDLRELLQQTVPPPARPLDTAALVRRARRQRRAARIAAGLSGVGILTAGLLVVPSLVTDRTGLEIAERPDREAVGSSQLWERSYVSVSITEAGQVRQLVPGTRIALMLTRFPLVRDVDTELGLDPDADGFVSWDAGCNRTRSQLYLSGGRMEFGGFSDTTASLCLSDELREQDRWIDEFLRSGPAWQLDGARLLLSAGEVTIVLEDPDVDVPALGRPDLQLGADHLWESSGTVEEAARTFLAEVLGWQTPTLLEQAGPPTSMFLLFENADGRPIELSLEIVSSSTDRWRVTQVSAGIEHPIRMTEQPSLLWRPSDNPRLRHGAFEGVVGTAYIGTPERGTIAVPIDEQALAAAEVPLDGIVGVGHPFCQIQTVLLLFENSEGVVTSALGAVTYGTETPPDCPIT
jgi:hypothetical protein